MATHSRYNVSNEENQEILKNKLRIKEQKMLDDTETLLLSDAYETFFKQLPNGKLKFDTKLIFAINQSFLNTLYSWAGKVRTVEISKGGVLFCASSQIKKELKNLNKIIKYNLPTPKNDTKQLSEKFAIIHCEFNAIHPFREGNGRTIRLFLDLLAANSGYKTIDYSKSRQKDYIQACIAGMNQDYSKLQKIIKKGLTKQH
jgi:cell filamentation protein